MADLISTANRLTDVEINNNKPVSSQTFRRIGSSVNYVLDYLGIGNGSTISGPATGLNVFSPTQNLNYSYAFTAADVGVLKTLFTFQGGGDRPLRFFRKLNGVEDPSTNFIGPQFGSTIMVYNQMSLIDFNFPIAYLLRLLSVSFVGTGTGPIFIVYVNGFEVGRTIRIFAPNSLATIQYTGEITLAPAGTNTVTVMRMMGTGTVNVAQNVNYVAL